jgi:SAM-dependent methyltransferase
MTRDVADRVVDLYDRHAHQWDSERWRNLFERPWLERFQKLLPAGGSILDIGCGSGEPLARYFIEAGFSLMGVDTSPSMIDLCRGRFPEQTWQAHDMRSLAIGHRYDGLLAWDSFFHLRRDDQRKMFPIFRAHAAPNAAVMFTSGPRDAEDIGSYQGEPLYHASLSPEEYRDLLDRHGFDVVAFVSEEPASGGRTVWLARCRSAPDLD